MAAEAGIEHAAFFALFLRGLCTELAEGRGNSLCRIGFHMGVVARAVALGAEFLRRQEHVGGVLALLGACVAVRASHVKVGGVFIRAACEPLVGNVGALDFRHHGTRRCICDRVALGASWEELPVACFFNWRIAREKYPLLDFLQR